MRTSIAFAALALALLPGCAALRPFAGGHCSGHSCKVLVTVDAACRITADPEHLYVPRDGEVHIHWKLDPPSAAFVFDVNGISFKPGQNPGEFDEKELQDNGKQFHWRDKNTRSGPYQYDINVRDAQGRLCHIDPFIHNQ